jgi:hypothetical protein
MIKRLSVIATLVIAGLVGSATAQSPNSLGKAKPQVPQMERPTFNGPGNGAVAAANKDGISPQLSIGWNYVHASNCAMWNYGGYPYVVLYPEEGGYFYTTTPAYQNAILAACQTGNWIAFDVYDGYGDWDELYTFAYF